MVVIHTGSAALAHESSLIFPDSLIKGEVMNIFLWIVQALLAAAFIMAGGMKIMTPYDALATQMTWVSYFPAFVPKVIGTFEVLGALGLMLPSLLRIKPALTPLAALGLALLMAGAFITHIVLGEYGMSLPSLVLGLLSLFVAWGRHNHSPIIAKD